MDNWCRCKYNKQLHSFPKMLWRIGAGCELGRIINLPSGIFSLQLITQFLFYVETFIIDNIYLFILRSSFNNINFYICNLALFLIMINYQFISLKNISKQLLYLIKFKLKTSNVVLE